MLGQADRRVGKQREARHRETVQLAGRQACQIERLRSARAIHQWAVSWE
jgi:hypothetical protein